MEGLVRIAGGVPGRLVLGRMARRGLALALPLFSLGCRPSPAQAEGAAPPVRLDRPAQRISPSVELDRPPAPAQTMPPASTDISLVVECSRQRLTLLQAGRPIASWPVSTSRFGLGSRAGSNCTPLGKHRIAEKIGEDAPLGTIFRSRQDTGQLAEIHRDQTDVEEDLVLTRILWLEGLEPGRNQGPGVDSKQRYIYIHGTNEEGLIGQPASHGCVRMRNEDVAELFSRVPVGTPVTILP